MTFSIFLLSSVPARADRLTVVASVFPLFDFARVVAGSEAQVQMLLPAGVEPHSWEPRPSDILKVSRADIFLYVSAAMEPWAHNLVGAVGGRVMTFVDMMDSLGLPPADGGQKRPEGRILHTADPHFWLDLSLSARAVEVIGLVLEKKDPGNRAGYAERTRAYAKRLEELDRSYTDGLENCRTRKFVTGGHSAFGYLAKRYNLTQISLYGISPDSEPTPAHLAAVASTMRKENLDVVFFEEMVNPRLARVLADEVGASTRVLTPAGNLTADRMKKGVSFIGVMEENLQSLREGLHCE